MNVKPNPLTSPLTGSMADPSALMRKLVFGSATGFQTLLFGSPAASGLGDAPVPADFDGDRKTDLAVYRPSTGQWFSVALTVTNTGGDDVTGITPALAVTMIGS